MARADKGMGGKANGQQGVRHASVDVEDAELTEAELAEDKMGKNRLQGEDAEKKHNERQAQPDRKLEADDVIESFKKLDKDYRANQDKG